MKKFLDDNGVLYLWSKITSLFVKKETGKGLISDEEKAKLAGLENYQLPTASAETLGGVKVGTGLEINNGILSATGGGTADAVQWENVVGKPTKLSEFTNDSNFQTDAQVTAAITSATTDMATKTYVDNKVSSVYKYKGSVANAAALPTENLAIGDVYNLEDTGMNVAWNGTEWDDLGSTVDLTGFLKDTDLVAITNAEIDAIVATE